MLAVQADGADRHQGQPGQRDAAAHTAAGKVLLAALPDAEARRILGPRKLPALTPHTITDPRPS